MKRLFTGILTAIMLFLGILMAPTAIADDGGLTPYINQFRNSAGQHSLATNSQLQDQAQNWATKLAASDGSTSVDPSLFNPAPAGFEGGTQIPAMGQNGADYLYVEGQIEKQHGSVVNDAAWNAVGIGTAKSVSGKVYVVLNLATINVRTAAPVPAPVPAPIPAPVPAPAPVDVIPEPAAPVVEEPAAPVDVAPSQPEPVVEPQTPPAATTLPAPSSSSEATAAPSPSASIIPTDSVAEPTTQPTSQVDELQAERVGINKPIASMFGAGSLFSLIAGLYGRRRMRIGAKH